MATLLCQSIFRCLAGSEDANDAERLSVDPAVRHMVGGRAGNRNGASTSQMSRFETEVLTQANNLPALMDLSGMSIDRLRRHRPIQENILDSATSTTPTHGNRQDLACNGRFNSPDSPGLAAAILRRIRRLAWPGLAHRWLIEPKFAEAMA